MEDEDRLREAEGLCRLYSHYLREFDRAEELLQQALEIAPQSAEIHYNLGLLYWNREEWESCVRAWQRALELDLDHRFVESVIAERLPQARARGGGD